jgi:hypothetical protein
MQRVSVTEITKALKGIEFPVDKEELLEFAREGGADEEVIDILEEMPDDEYGSITDVMHAFGEVDRNEKDEDGGEEEEEDEKPRSRSSRS